MGSESEKWDYRTEMTIKELFNPPIIQPHRGILAIVRELERVLGKEEAHGLVGDVIEREREKISKEMARRNPINSFRDFVELFEGGDVRCVVSCQRRRVGGLHGEHPFRQDRGLSLG